MSGDELPPVIAKLIAETHGFTTNIDGVIGHIKRAEESTRAAMHGIESSTREAEGGFGRLGEAAHKLGERLVEAFAAERILEFGRSAVEAAEVAEKAEKLTEAAIASTGGAAQLTAEQVGHLATSLSEHNAVSVDAVHSAENLLLTFTNIRDAGGKAGGTYDQATQSIIDMTAAMNNGNVTMENVKATTLQVGKALNDPIKGMTALQRVGVAFTNAQKDVVKHLVDTGRGAKAQELILAELKREFGGAAEAMATPMDRAKNAMHNASIEIGTDLLPMVSRLYTWVATRAAPAVKHFVDELVHGSGGWATFRQDAALALVVLQKVGGWIVDLTHFLGDHKTAVEVAAAAVIAFGVAYKGVAFVGAMIEGMATAFWALDAAMAANPVGLIIAGIAAVIAIVVVLYEKFDGVRYVVNTMAKAAVDALSRILDGFLTVFSAVEHLGAKIPFIGKLFGGIGDAADWVKGKVDELRASVDSLPTSKTMDIHLRIMKTIQDFNSSPVMSGGGSLGFGQSSGGSIATASDGSSAMAAWLDAQNKKSVDAANSAIEGIGAHIGAGGGGSQVFSGSGGGGGGGGGGSGGLPTTVKQAIAAAKAALKGITTELSARTFVHSITGTPEQIQSQFDKLLNNLKAYNQGPIANYARLVEAQLLGLAAKHIKLADAIKAASTNLTDMKKAAADYAANIAAGIRDSGDPTKVGGVGGFPVNFFDVSRAEQATLEQARSFQAKISLLIKSGLNSTELQAILAAGPEAGLATATAIAEGGKAGIDSLNAMQSQLDKIGTDLGTSTASHFYDSGVKMAQGIVSGLESQQAALDRVMTKLATTMTNQIKKALKIHSPSGVMFDMFRDQVGGAAVLGLERSIGDMAKVSGRLAGAAIPSVSGGGVHALQAAGGGRGGGWGTLTIHVPLNVDGRTFARATASYTRDELLRVGRGLPSLGLA